ncbi:MAG TPA: hypothetical protein VK157_07535 [Phycisphaerales bacterium]|nr:hypothetical protein [Phycisphaerales bacterium]
MRLSIATLITAAAFATPALAQRTITFDAAAIGSLPSAPGVTFQLFSPPAGTGINWPVSGGAYIGGGVTAIPSTSSGGRGIQTPTASAGFSPEGIRLLFALDQPRVKFTVGVGEPNVSNCIYRVNGYTASGTLIFSRDYPIGNSPTLNCNSLVDVDVSSTANRIRRLDIVCLLTNGVNGEYREVLDTLEYFGDLTPPVTSITSPIDDTCIDPIAAIFGGFSYEPDGTYTNEIWEYAPELEGPWTLITQLTTPLAPPGGNLINWGTGPVPAGWYFVRVTARNIDKLETQTFRRVFIDRINPTISVREPAANTIVGGTVCFDGSTSDSGCALSTYALAYRPAGSAAEFTTILSGTASITNDPLGSWNTRAPLVPDGAYEVFATAADSFNNQSLNSRTLIVDNTPPIATISNILACDGLGAEGPVVIRGTATDANISGWSLAYTTGSSTGWTTIATGTTNMTNAVLGVWNTASLPACAATLRLTVNDRSLVNCSTVNSSSHYISVRIKRPGTCSDIDFNNNGVFPEDQDVIDFFNVLAGGSCGG